MTHSHTLSSLSTFSCQQQGEEKETEEHFRSPLAQTQSHPHPHPPFRPPPPRRLRSILNHLSSGRNTKTNKTDDEKNNNNNDNNNNNNHYNSLIVQVEKIGIMKIGLNPNQFSSSKSNRKTFRGNRKTLSSSSSSSSSTSSSWSIASIFTGILVILIIIYIIVLFQYSSATSSLSSTSSTSTLTSSSSSGQQQQKHGNDIITIGNINTNINTNININTKPRPLTCNFREYPKRRHYGLQKRPMPNFLSNVEYIYGELPRILEISPSPKLTSSTSSTTTLVSQKKLCVDQSEWYHLNPTIELPFADGTNPSVLQIPKSTSYYQSIVPPNAKYLMTICMTNSQCSWKDSPEEMIQYKLSQQTEPSTVRTVLLIVDESLNTLQEFTITMEMDAPFGKKKKKFPLGTQKMLALDDARLFLFRNEIWISYREGPLMGYDKQVLNKLHFQTKTITSTTSSSTTNGTPTTTTIIENVKMYASEVETLCCGRNMALITNHHHHNNMESDTLKALTWVDPITVVDVPIKATTNDNNNNNQRQRQLQLLQETLEITNITDATTYNNHHFQSTSTSSLKAKTHNDDDSSRIISNSISSNDHSNGQHQQQQQQQQQDKEESTNNSNNNNDKLIATTTTNISNQQQQQPRQDLSSSSSSALFLWNNQSFVSSSSSFSTDTRQLKGNNPNDNNKEKEEQPPRKSHFHGTNGFMVHLPKTKEYLGIGHFHRPPERDYDNIYARFGHHYTHAFFTIPDQPPYRLQRLSQELVLPLASTTHIKGHRKNDDESEDAEIIQFWSGLELIQDFDDLDDHGNPKNLLLLAYGINDCEGAATYIDLSLVQDLLWVVPEGMEVVDLMMPLKQ